MKRGSILWRIALLVALVAAAAVAWWLMIRMPGNVFQRPLPPLTPEQIKLRAELISDVQALAGNIGERNFRRYRELIAASDFIERSFSAAGLRPRRDRYDMRGQSFDNIETEIRGTQPEIVLIGAHYDSVLGSPGANDNGSGVAALLALARRFAGKPCLRTLRFVAFVNEEPPMFQSPEMGSYVYASRCRVAGDRIAAMISLETIGYYSDAPRSQSYPFPGLGLFYPTTGNFIGFVGNVPSRTLVREAIGQFRQHAQIPSQGAALPSGIPGVGWSDQWAFWQHGYRGIMITDTAPFRYPHYHSRSDMPDKLNYDTMARVVQGLEKVIDHLTRSDSE
jgi:Peptidase family M28